MDYLEIFNFTAKAVRVAEGSAKQRCLELVLGKINAVVSYAFIYYNFLDFNTIKAGHEYTSRYSIGSSIYIVVNLLKVLQFFSSKSIKN